MNPWPSSQRGITLVEVLVGLIILSIALLAALRGIAAIANTQTAVSTRQAALWSADNWHIQMQLQQEWPDLGTTLTPCPQMQYQFICQRKVISTPNPLFRRVEIGVFLKGDGDLNSSQLAWLVQVIVRKNAGVL